MNKKVALVIASQGYQPKEYGDPKRILEDVGFEVITVSNRYGVARAADGGFNTEVDTTVENLNIEDYDALFFIGGSGALEHLDNETSYILLKKWKETGKPYGAICISPRILAKAGVLKNKKATGWDGDNELTRIFGKYGVEYAREDVVVDGNIITANGPEASEEFGKAILSLLS